MWCKVGQTAGTRSAKKCDLTVSTVWDQSWRWDSAENEQNHHPSLAQTQYPQQDPWRTSRYSEELPQGYRCCVLAWVEARDHPVGRVLLDLSKQCSKPETTTYIAARDATTCLAHLSFQPVILQQAELHHHGRLLLKVSSSEEDAQHYLNSFGTVMSEIFTEWGLPHTIKTDNETQYVSQEFLEILASHKIRLITSSPHHPQSSAWKKLM